MTTYTVSEAAQALGMTYYELLAFDQTLTPGSVITQDELDELRHVRENTDEDGVYHAPEDS